MTDVRQHLRARARGVCEACNKPLWDSGELDHFFGRAKAEETEFLCWLLCRDCHHKKTNNDPSAAFWLQAFMKHCARYVGDGYREAAYQAQKKLDWLRAKGTSGEARMAEARAVNLRKEAYDVYIGRAGKGQDGYFGNPFTIQQHGKDALPLFIDYFHKRIDSDPEFKKRVIALAGKRLGCFCKPRDCHGDVIAAWVNTWAEVFSG